MVCHLIIVNLFEKEGTVYGCSDKWNLLEEYCKDVDGLKALFLQEFVNF